MKIEPCLYCGGKMLECTEGKFHSCAECGIVVDFNDVPRHNRLSRIVRAAEAMARFTEDKMDDFDAFAAYQNDCRAVVDAVNEGGAE